MSMQGDFKGRRILITGGAQGIGQCIANKFLDAAAEKVFVLDKDAQKLEELKSSIPSLTTLCVDITNWEETQAAIQNVPGVIHHLVNNAGIAQPVQKFTEITPEAFDLVMNVNVKAMINVTQVVTKRMIENGIKGTVVNMSSISDSLATPRLTMYSCSKAAVTMLTKSAAIELGLYGIRVNCVRPSMVRTENVGKLSGSGEVLNSVIQTNSRNVLKSMVDMNEVADAVLFLSSSASSVITGSQLTLDGGITIT